MSREPSPGHRVGYVVKVYPRFSETFVVTEILAREAAGEDIAVYALRPTSDARFHPQLAQVRAPVTHVPRTHKLSTEWALLARAHEELPGFAEAFGTLMPMLVRMGPSDAAQAVDLALRLRADGITHVHVHFANVASWCAAAACALVGIPFTVTTHAKDLFHDSVDRTLLTQVLTRAELVVAISDYNARFLVEQVGIPADRVRLVRNGIDLPRFPYADPSPPQSPLRVLAVGRLVEKKGFRHLVEAAAALGDDVPIEVRIVGDGDLAGALHEQIAALGVDGRVRLVGPRSQAELIDELQWADVFVAPCVVGADGNADGLPTVILESMASGVPCIATDVTGIPEAIHPQTRTEPRTGILLGQAADDLSPRLADALREVADPLWPRVQVARAARAAVERDFDTTRQARRLADLESPAPRDEAVAS